MPRSDRRMSVHQVTDGYPDPGDNTTLVTKPVSKERRLGLRRISDKLGGHSVKLESNARWLKTFLHPGG